MKVTKLNDTQKKEAIDFLKDYKFIYVCNKCGGVYGTELQEAKQVKLCHVCEVKRDRKKKEEKNE